MWTARQRCAWRSSSPLMCVMQLTSQRATASAPLSAMARVLRITHGGADLGVLDGEEPTKAATFVGAGQRDQFGVGHMIQQLPGLAVDAQLAQKVTAGVIGQLALEPGADIVDAEHVDEELSQFEGDSPKHLRPCLVARIRQIFEEHGIEMAGHRCTASAWRNHRIDLTAAHQGLENVDKTARQFGGFSAIAGVECRLATAGLFGRKNDLHPVTFEQFYSGHADFGVEHVDHAGDKKCYPSGWVGEWFFHLETLSQKGSGSSNAGATERCVHAGEIERLKSYKTNVLFCGSGF